MVSNHRVTGQSRDSRPRGTACLASSSTIQLRESGAVMPRRVGLAALSASRARPPGGVSPDAPCDGGRDRTEKRQARPTAERSLTRAERLATVNCCQSDAHRLRRRVSLRARLALAAATPPPRTSTRISRIFIRELSLTIHGGGKHDGSCPASKQAAGQRLPEHGGSMISCTPRRAWGRTRIS